MTRSWTKRLPDCKTCRPVLQEGNSNRATARGESHTDGFRTGVRFPSDPPYKERAPRSGCALFVWSLFGWNRTPRICSAIGGRCKYQDSRHPIRSPDNLVRRESGVAVRPEGAQRRFPSDPLRFLSAFPVAFIFLVRKTPFYGLFSSFSKIF